MSPFPGRWEGGPGGVQGSRPHSGVAAFRPAAVGHKVPIREVRPKTTCLPEKMVRAASRSVRDGPVLAAAVPGVASANANAAPRTVSTTRSGPVE